MKFLIVSTLFFVFGFGSLVGCGNNTIIGDEIIEKKSLEETASEKSLMEEKLDSALQAEKLHLAQLYSGGEPGLIRVLGANLVNLDSEANLSLVNSLKVIFEFGGHLRKQDNKVHRENGLILTSDNPSPEMRKYISQVLAEDETKYNGFLDKYPSDTHLTLGCTSNLVNLNKDRASDAAEQSQQIQEILALEIPDTSREVKLSPEEMTLSIDTGTFNLTAGTIVLCGRFLPSSDLNIMAKKLVLIDFEAESVQAVDHGIFVAAQDLKIFGNNLLKVTGHPDEQKPAETGKISLIVTKSYAAAEDSQLTLHSVGGINKRLRNEFKTKNENCPEGVQCSNKPR